MNNEVKEISLNFLSEYIPTCHAAMITGSASTSEMTSTSDIDILILDNNITRDYFETIYYQNYKIDCIIMPLVSIESILNEERERNSIVYIGMLSKGVVIKDTFKSLTKLKDYATILKEMGPTPATAQIKKMVLFQAYNLYEDLLVERDFSETLYIAIDLFQQLIRLNSVFHNHWTSNKGKWRFRYLNQFDEKFTANITDSFRKIISEQDKSDFLHFAKDNLSGYGAPPKQYSSRNYTFMIKNEILTISTKSTTFIKDVYNIFLSKLKNRLNFFRSSIEMFYIRNDGNIYDQSDYLIFIHGEDEILNFIISPVLLRFFTEKNNLLKENSIISSLNYNLEPQHLFANQDLYKLAKPLLMHFNSITEHTDGFDESLILTYLTQLHLCLGSKLGMTISDYITFNEYFFNMLLPFSIDHNKEISFRKLEEIRTSRINEYEHIYNKQKKRMIRNYSNIFDQWGHSNFDYIEEYFVKGLDLIDSFYEKLTDNFFIDHSIPQFKLAQISNEKSDLEKKRWLSLFELLSTLYSSVLLSSDQKSYLVFSCSALLNEFITKDGTHLNENGIDASGDEISHGIDLSFNPVKTI